MAPDPAPKMPASRKSKERLMFLGRVIATVWATQKVQSTEGLKLLVGGLDPDRRAYRCREIGTEMNPSACALHELLVRLDKVVQTDVS